MNPGSSSKFLIPCFVVLVVAVGIMVLVLAFASRIFPPRVTLLETTIRELTELESLVDQESVVSLPVTDFVDTE